MPWIQKEIRNADIALRNKLCGNFQQTVKKQKKFCHVKKKTYICNVEKTRIK